MNIMHFGHDRKKGRGMDLGWEALAVMMGIGLAIVIRLLWSLGTWLGMK